METYTTNVTILQDKMVHKVVECMAPNLTGESLEKVFRDFYPTGANGLDFFDLLNVDWDDLALAFNGY
jgi:hypothetical protein